MASKFFRAPGATVTYNAYQTREYVSRKARVSRGLFITPARRDRTPDGWRFWFPSPRGPASDRGNWKVDVVRFEEDDDPTPPPYTFVGGQLCIGGICYSVGGDSVGTPYLDDKRPFYWMRTTNQGAAWVDVGTPYDALVSQYGSANVKPSDFGPNRGFVRASVYLSPGPSTEQATGVVTGGGTLGAIATLPAPGNSGLFAIEQRYYYLLNFFNRCNTARVILRSTPGYFYETPSAVTFTRQYTTAADPIPYWFFPTYTGTNDQPNCLVDGPGYDGPWPLPSDSGGGGALPDGYLPGAGPWAYACSCPDFTGEETRYRVATAPSHRRDRSWGQIRPESPCKHIASSAKALGDQKTLVKWVRTFKDDSPGSEFSQSPTVIIDRSYLNEQRRQEAAFRRTTRNMRRATAALNRQQRAERSALALSNRLGRVWRMNADGTTTSSKKRGRFGESLEGVQVPNWYGIDPTNGGDQFSREWDERMRRYQSRPDVRVRNAIGGVLSNAGDRIQRNLPMPPPSSYLAGFDEWSKQNPNRRSNHLFDTYGGERFSDAVYGQGMRRVGTFDPRVIPTVRVHPAPTAATLSINSNPEAYGY
ncbi:hypothetical protein IQ265_13795 [Nodosilinea sp. LEGE 06152]|uniref:hypothetical protein n=1 Tax=Nodosilinea sp. LEGE 06152 TaxID=2777966 RepID=UPI00187ED0FD|nr:hypothetical protein [Nodosilinea sp. LEGE 06152]MBE9157889.1 hypothetical protein [Nodosilinea sp. LEGE 06152]